MISVLYDGGSDLEFTNAIDSSKIEDVIPDSYKEQAMRTANNTGCTYIKEYLRENLKEVHDFLEIGYGDDQSELTLMEYLKKYLQVAVKKFYYYKRTF